MNWRVAHSYQGMKSLPFGTLIFGAVLDELSKFFHKVNEDVMKTVSVTYPESIADQVEVKEETKKAE